MDSHREKRVSETLREELDELIAYELSDPERRHGCNGSSGFSRMKHVRCVCTYRMTRRSGRILSAHLKEPATSCGTN